MSERQILPMAQEHLDTVAALESACFPDPWTLPILSAELTNPISLWLVAVEDGTLCGYVGSQTCGDESDLMNLAVAPACRRSGVATELLDTLCEMLSRRGSRTLTLEVRDSNRAAAALYEKLGFCEVGRRKNYYFHPTEDARILRKELICP